MLWTLIRLRQLLLWAQARTGTGRRALFAAGYVLGGSLFLLLILAGSETATLSTLRERDAETARWIFSGIWGLGASLNLVLGRGARQSSMDAVLRRYPLTRMGRLSLRHLSGLLDPVWLFLAVSTIGVAAAYSSAGPYRVLLTVPISFLI